MRFKQLLWLGGLLGLGGTALIYGGIRSGLLPGLPANAAGVQLNLPGTTDRPTFSGAVLPLPPLLLPELLLPPYNYPSFNSERLDQELRLYAQYLRTNGTPDVLIVGSSRSLQGIDPVALQAALAEQGYPDVKVYNFGVNGATAQVVHLVLQRVLDREHLPRLIIWGDGLRAFNSSQVDRTYNRIAESAGYQRLASGSRPIPPRRQWDIPALAANAATSTADKANPQPLPTPRLSQPIAPDLTENGFEPVDQVFDPATYYRQYPRVPGAYDEDYLNFQFWGRQSDATAAIGNFARSQRLELVFVNLPLTRDYLDRTRLNYEANFRAGMQEIAQQQDFAFVNLLQHPTLQRNAYFADPSHINQAGAAAVARQLAQEESIPWEVLRSPQ